MFNKSALGNLKPEFTVVDSPYLQEIGSQIETDSPVNAVAFLGDTLYAGMDDGLKIVSGGKLKPGPKTVGAVRQLLPVENRLYIRSADGLHVLSGKKVKKLSDSDFAALATDGEEVFAATPGTLYRVSEDGAKAIPGSDSGHPPIHHLACFQGMLVTGHYGGLLCFDGHKWSRELYDWGQIPSQNVTCLLPDGNKLYIGTERGICILRGMTLHVIRGRDGLPREDVTSLGLGFGGDLWIGSNRGVSRKTGDEYHYFAWQRWLPGDRVTAICERDKTVCVACDKGIGIIEYKPMTLEEKGEHYEKLLERDQKLRGFVYKLEWDDAGGEFYKEISDNDGCWTAYYLGAMSCKYAVTRNEKDRRNAVEAFNAIKSLEEISTIDGFPARAYMRKGEKKVHQSGGEWHESADGKWLWKADTSSDEVDGHVWCCALFYDLVANDEEKKRVAEHLGRIAHHIVDHGFCLIDLDGKPTTWARWEPDYLMSPRGQGQRGLNCMEMLSILRGAHHVTGEEKFLKAYRYLIDEHSYHTQFLRQKLTFTPEWINHSDDVLAFFAYQPLIAYEDDPELRAIYLRSFERSFEIERPERMSLFNFIYGALTGLECEAGATLKELREWPLDILKYTYCNSCRHDLEVARNEPAFNCFAATQTISCRESNPRRWCARPNEMDSGHNMREVEDPSGWLAAYWLGRYCGYIKSAREKE
ncbi:MAG TPA: hypothetical protein PL033_17300 [Candidatus Brocadiia bacterium]|nr:hypothetical protein [Candidatus Brocadiia bacterium]